jgi:hypothetical protein
MAGFISYQTKMNPNSADNYFKFKADAEAVLAAAGYTPDKMLWESWRGLDSKATTKTLTDADGNTYAFTAGMANFGIYSLFVSKNGAPTLNVYSFCDR